MPTLTVDSRGGLSFQVRSRNHSFVVDLPEESGGGDAGMTPPEHFIASLGACIGVYVARYCRNVRGRAGAELNTEGMRISLSWRYDDDKTKISNIDAEITLPHADLGNRAKAVLDVAHHCLIHNTLMNSPRISIALKKK